MRSRLGAHRMIQVLGIIEISRVGECIAQNACAKYSQGDSCSRSVRIIHKNVCDRNVSSDLILIRSPRNPSPRVKFFFELSSKPAIDADTYKSALISIPFAIRKILAVLAFDPDAARAH